MPGASSAVKDTGFMSDRPTSLRYPLRVARAPARKRMSTRPVSDQNRFDQKQASASARS